MRGRNHLDSLDDEIRDHLEREAQDNIDRGMTPEAARAAAHRRFGNATLAKEDARGVWVPVWFDQLVQDVRYGLRMLRRSPGFSAVVVATLALGIGMNTAVFSVINAVLLRPLSYPHPDRVVWVAAVDPRTADEHVAAHDFLAWRTATTLGRLVAHDVLDDRIRRGDVIAPARVAMVTDDFWEFTGARPAAGRLPRPGEAAVMLSHAFFERWFASDRTVIGTVVTIEGTDMTVAGVLPPGFHVQLLPPPAWAGLVPKPVDAYRVFTVAPPEDGRVQLLRVLALLKPGVSADTARAELETIRSRIARANPALPFEGSLRVMPLADKLVGPARASLLVLFAAVVLVLLIACANIASLFLARSSARQREIALRTAVGAGRERILRQFLVESLLVASAGAVGGVIVARLALGVTLKLIPHAMPRLTEATIDPRVLAFALMTSAATALLFGVGPALALSKTNAYDVLRDGARTPSAPMGGGRVREWLVAAQIALTVVLLCGAGLLVKSIWRMREYPPPFAPDRTLVATVRFFYPASENDDRRRTYFDEALRRLPSLPGVEAVGLTTSGGGRMRLFIEGAPRASRGDEPVAIESAVSSGYAKAVGMRMVAGRWFAEAEPNPVFVVNESLARRNFGGDAVGKRIQVGGRPGAADAIYGSVIGVVADLRYSRLDASPEPEIFVHYADAPPFTATIVVRAAADPMSVASAVRARLVAIDKAQDVSEVDTLERALAESIAPRRFNVFLFGTFAAVALVLAVIGIYGVTAYSVAQRTHEIGLRIALGAERHTVVSMVVQRGMRVATAGLLFGILAALAATRLIAGLLYGVTPTDPATFAVVAAMLNATAGAACCGPAIKAARVDPVVALRSE